MALFTEKSFPPEYDVLEIMDLVRNPLLALKSVGEVNLPGPQS